MATDTPKNGAVPLLEALQAALDYRFHDATLAVCALTLPSYHFEAVTGHDNQRLEFLGDAVLGLLAAEHLYRDFPQLDEGAMSLLRTLVTSDRALAAVAREVGLNALLLIGRSEEVTGGRERDGALADALEAVFGAVWLDGGLEAVRLLYQRLLAHRIGEADIADAARRENPKGRLQEITQACDGSVPHYKLLEVSGPGHRPCYRVAVELSSGLVATSEGASKRAAEAAAAEAALERLDISERDKK